MFEFIIWVEKRAFGALFYLNRKFAKIYSKNGYSGIKALSAIKIF